MLIDGILSRLTGMRDVLSTGFRWLAPGLAGVGLLNWGGLQHMGVRAQETGIRGWKRDYELTHCSFIICHFPICFPFVIC